MKLFGRRGRDADGGSTDQPRSGPRHAARRRTRDEFGYADEAQAPARTTGPYDVTDAPDGVELLDLGSLRVPVVDGVEVRLQADANGQVRQVVLASGASALELSAFAAPRTEGIWDEVRDDIRTQLSREEATVSELDGEYGRELRVRARTPEGPTDLRFVGLEGPRWLVRAVFHGPAATDPAAAGPLADCLRGLVVDRGDEAMPVRDALPLRLPREIAEQAQAQEAAEASGDPGADDSAQPAGRPAGSRRRRS